MARKHALRTALSGAVLAGLLLLVILPIITATVRVTEWPLWGQGPGKRGKK